MQKTVICLSTIVILATSFSSCRKKYEIVVSGQVINYVTGESIEGALVHLADGVGNSDVFVQGDGVSTVDKTQSGPNGEFYVRIKSESSHGAIYAYKDGYLGINSAGKKEIELIGEGNHQLDLTLQGIAHFNGLFKKKDGVLSSDDMVSIDLLSYSSLDDSWNNFGATSYTGTGPFTFFISGNKVSVIGDRYLRYKIEYTDQGVWHTKIDSVFLPTSSEVYTDTIYY